MGQLEGKTAVVTGGSTGIGLATARRFAEEGATVYLTGRRKDVLDDAVTSIGRGAVGVPGDVSQPGDLDRLYETIAGDGRGVDVLFANAGVGEAAALAQVTEAHLDHLLGVNVKGTVFTVQKALPLLSDHASVILSASCWTGEGIEGFGVYSASKAALRSFARTWANELKGRGIRVNAVSAGTTDTPGLDGAPGRGRRTGESGQGRPGLADSLGAHRYCRRGGQRRPVPGLLAEQFRQCRGVVRGRGNHADLMSDAGVQDFRVSRGVTPNAFRYAVANEEWLAKPQAYATWAIE